MAIRDAEGKHSKDHLNNPYIVRTVMGYGDTSIILRKMSLSMADWSWCAPSVQRPVNFRWCSLFWEEEGFRGDDTHVGLPFTFHKQMRYRFCLNLPPTTIKSSIQKY